MSLSIAVFASGGGTNLQALLDHFGADGGSAAGQSSEGGPGRLARIRLVVSDRGEAGALERARRAGAEARVVGIGNRSADEVGEELVGLLRDVGADLVVLAGYLRLMPEAVVRAFRGRMLNIHPALLPAFGGRGMYGKHIHRAVLAAGCKVSGVTVHFVDGRYDTGPILAQWPVPVLAGDTPERLAARVLAVEHRVLPLAVEEVARRIIAAGEDGQGLDEIDSIRIGAQGAGRATFGLYGGDAPSEEDIRRLLGFDLGQG